MISLPCLKAKDSFSSVTQSTCFSPALSKTRSVHLPSFVSTRLFAESSKECALSGGYVPLAGFETLPQTCGGYSVWTYVDPIALMLSGPSARSRYNYPVAPVPYALGVDFVGSKVPP